MKPMKIAVNLTFSVDIDEILARVHPLPQFSIADLKCALRVMMRREVCEDKLRGGFGECLDEGYISIRLMEEGIADPLPGFETDHWDEILEQRQLCEYFFDGIGRCYFDLETRQFIKIEDEKKSET